MSLNQPFILEGVKSNEELLPIIEEYGKSRICLLSFGASWCKPCKNIKKEIYDSSDNEGKNGLSKIYAKNIAFFYIDVEQNPELEKIYSIQSVPVFIAVRTSKNQINILKTIVGGNKQNLEKGIKELITSGV